MLAKQAVASGKSDVWAENWKRERDVGDAIMKNPNAVAKIAISKLERGISDIVAEEMANLFISDPDRADKFMKRFTKKVDDAKGEMDSLIKKYDKKKSKKADLIPAAAAKPVKATPTKTTPTKTTPVKKTTPMKKFMMEMSDEDTESEPEPEAVSDSESDLDTESELEYEPEPETESEPEPEPEPEPVPVKKGRGRPSKKSGATPIQEPIQEPIQVPVQEPKAKFKTTKVKKGHN